MATGQNGQAGDLPTEILHLLSKKDPILSSEDLPSQKSADVKSAITSLASRLMVTYETIDREEAILEAEGVEIEANGSHEARVFEALRSAVEGLTLKELETTIGGDKKAVALGQGRAFKSKWISRGKDGRFVASVSSCGQKEAGLVTDCCRRTQYKTQPASNCRSSRRLAHIRIQRSLQI